MRRALICCCLTLWCLTVSLCQSNVFLMTNSQEIDPNRYQDIKGSPYLFGNWARGDIIDLQGDLHTYILLNFNGYTGEVEVKLNDQFIELNEQDYKEIRVLSKENDPPMVFKSKVHEQFQGRFVQLIYQGSKINFIKDFNVVYSDEEIHNVGETLVVKRFAKQITYYLMADGKLQLTKLRKKKILELLGHKKELESVIKHNRLDIQTEEGLTQLLDYYESM